MLFSLIEYHTLFDERVWNVDVLSPLWLWSFLKNYEGIYAFVYTFCIDIYASLYAQLSVYTVP